VARRPELRALALRAGITPSYVSLVDRRERHTSDETREALLAAMQLDASSERSAAAARRTLEERVLALPPVAELGTAPLRCTGVREKLGRRRGFGVWANLYTLRSRRDSGVGDLSDLARLARLAAREGADFVGISPLHALWNRGPHVSPYAPVSRFHRNPLYLDVRAVPELARCPEARRLLAGPGLRRELEQLRGSPRVEYARVAAAQRGTLRALHACFASRPAAARARAYAAFLAREGEALTDFATFVAIGERRAARRGRARLRSWPRELQDVLGRGRAVPGVSTRARSTSIARPVRASTRSAPRQRQPNARGWRSASFPTSRSERGGAETLELSGSLRRRRRPGPRRLQSGGHDWLSRRSTCLPARAGIRVLPTGAGRPFRMPGAAHRPHPGLLPALLDSARSACREVRLRAPAPARELLRDPGAREPRQAGDRRGPRHGAAGAQAQLARHRGSRPRASSLRARERASARRAWSKRALATSNTHDRCRCRIRRRRSRAAPPRAGDSEREAPSALAQRAASARALATA
jgi:hypothetical protein